MAGMRMRREQMASGTMEMEKRRRARDPASLILDAQYLEGLLLKVSRP
jgi:hypothetical protein